MTAQLQIGNGASTQPIVLNSAGHLDLPHIHLIPSQGGGATPLVQSVRGSVTGPASCAALLEAGYRDLLMQPTPLMEHLTFQPWNLSPKDNPLTPGAYKLDVAVQLVMPSNFSGSGSRVLATSATLLVPEDVNNIAKISANWKQRAAIIDEQSAVLELAIDHLPVGKLPTIQINHSESNAPAALITIVERCLANTLPEIVLRTTERVTLEQTFNLQADPDLRENLEDIDMAHIALCVTIPGIDERCELNGDRGLLVDCAGHVFPGHPVLDVGSSSVFATLFFSPLVTGQLPVETELTLRRVLMQWLDTNPPNVDKEAWHAILEDVVRELQLASEHSYLPPMQALKQFLKLNVATDRRLDTALHKVLRALEICAMRGCVRTDVRLKLYNEMFRVYSQAFRRFPLRRNRLVALDLNSTEAKPSSTGTGHWLDSVSNALIGRAIPSTIKITKCNPLTVEIGSGPDREWREMEGDPQKFTSRYFPTAKTFYSLLSSTRNDILVSDGETETYVSARQFITAVFRRITERIIQNVQAMQEQIPHLPKSSFRKVILLFPTSAPLAVRRVLLQIARDAGFDVPVADLDEALAAVIFYLVSPFGADVEMGLEAFRAACRAIPNVNPGLEPNQWKQNLLLIDVGGTTLDIALIEARLQDLNAPGAGDGSKGRYYRLTPSLLGATGRNQLGGDYITLQLFHELKVRLADSLLTQLSTEDLQSQLLGQNATRSPQTEALLESIRQLPAEFIKDGRYAPGALLEHRSTSRWASSGTDELSASAFQTIDQVIPTAWKGVQSSENKARTSHIFARLWTLADQMKIHQFGSNEPLQQVCITKDQLASLLELPELRMLELRDVVITREHFEQSVESALNEVAETALSLVKARLASQPTNDRILDRIILTGQTCRLPLLRKRIVEVFALASQSMLQMGRVVEDDNAVFFEWDPTKLTFEQEDAKPAAAIGAAYAQLIRESRVSHLAVDELKGNKLDVDIRNLFQFLPSGFAVRGWGGSTELTTVLHPCQQFTETDNDGNGRIQSNWSTAARRVFRVDRVDYEADGGLPWGEIECEEICKETELDWDTFAREVRLAIEANHRLDVNVLFCRGGIPHYALPASKPISLLECTQHISSPLGLETFNCFSTFENWEVGVNMLTGYGRTLFTIRRDQLTDTFRRADGSQLAGKLSVPFPTTTENEMDTFYIRPTDGSTDWIEVARRRRPASNGMLQTSVRAILDADGNLWIHNGEVPFWYASSARELADTGTVLRRKLKVVEAYVDDLRNPRCGRH